MREDEPDPAPVAAAKPSVVTTTVAVLRLLASTERPIGVNAIARELSLAPSSCFKILKHLHAEDFVDFDTLTKGYSLGSGAISLARNALDPLKAFSIVRPRLEQTASSYSMAIGFWRRVRGARIVLAGFIEGDSPMRIHMSVGQRLPMLMGAVGRAIAGELDVPEQDLREEFGRLRWQVPLTFEEYLAQVREARTQGFAVDRDNFATGVTTVAVAIRDANGAVRYGFSGIMFSGQHDAETIARAGQDFIALADWASSRLIAA
ncbi:IclR family transcriptional regulator [Sphingomonas profundi]|uniref:IclR family transcriptional regulator n=1 Tax=Alterirhizorhabdus profundi TaxID=2681549 RepID=UPI0018D1F068|nr:IclR family transcriptional regulator C-terminal domain-containing protein [Sphingomonas profundi]